MSQGRLQMTFKNYFAAEAEFQAALAEVAGDFEAMRELQQAQAARRKKDSYDRHMTLGRSYLAGKNYAQAEAEFNAALADIAGDPVAMQQLQQVRLARQSGPAKGK